MNAIYRVGDDGYARLPRLAVGEAALQREARWLPWLAPQLSFLILAPNGLGRPSAVPWRGRCTAGWMASYTRTRASGTKSRPRVTWRGSCCKWRRLDPAGAPPAGRKPLRQLDGETRAAIEASRTVVDAGGCPVARLNAVAILNVDPDNSMPAARWNR